MEEMFYLLNPDIFPSLNFSVISQRPNFEYRFSVNNNISFKAFEFVSIWNINFIKF